MIKKKALNVIGEALVIAIIIASAQLIYGALTTVTTIGNTGVIASANLRIYWEEQCISSVINIPWGYMNPGENKSVTVYVKNIGTVPLTLSMETSNWQPTNASTFFTLTWNYLGNNIESNTVASVTLYLSVSKDIQGISDFQFQITITGTQAT